MSVCGRSIYDLFLHGYETKRLRFDPHGIDPGWTARLVAPSFRSLLATDNADTAHAAIHDATFLYPDNDGIESLPRSLASRISQDCVQYNRELIAIDAASRGIVFRNGDSESFDTLTLSLPLPVIVSMLRDPPADVVAAAENLLFTSIYVLSLGVSRPVHCEQSILRFPDPEVDFYRVSFPGSYSPSSVPDGCSSVVVEFSFHPRRYPVGREEVRERSYQGLRNVGVLTRSHRVVVEHMKKIPYGHIIYSRHTADSVRTILDYLGRNSIFTCGKYARWSDMLMPQSLLSGIETARQIIDMANCHDRIRSAYHSQARLAER
jgi:protoporphyrinogen oxidase